MDFESHLNLLGGRMVGGGEIIPKGRYCQRKDLLPVFHLMTLPQGRDLEHAHLVKMNGMGRNDSKLVVLQISRKKRFAIYRIICCF